MTFAACFSSSLEILGVLIGIFYPILRNIGGAIVPPVPAPLLMDRLAIRDAWTILLIQTADSLLIHFMAS